MSLIATSNPDQTPFSVSKMEASLPELLMLRFVGDECIEGTAGQFWQTLLAVDYDATPDLPRILPGTMIESLLSISRAICPGELKFWNTDIIVGGRRHLLEAQITLNSLDECVILLRDVTIAARVQANCELSTALLTKLSPRELEVLRLLIRGEPNKSMAARLQISAKTVEKHRASIMRKTGARNSAELIRLTCFHFCDPMNC